MTSIKEPGGGKGRPLFVGKRIGTRPVPSVFIGNKPGGGGGKSDEGGRVKFGGGRRPNGDGKFSPGFGMDAGGKGKGHAEFVVVVDVVGAGILVTMLAGFVKELSVVDGGF